MSKTPNSKIDKSQPPVYEIRIEGHLDSLWKDWFEGLTITPEEDGDTLLTGPVIDQAALHGLLKKVRDLGMPLVSIRQVQFNETHPYRSKKGDKKMNSNIKDTKMKDKKVVLSALWLFAMLNYLYADVFTLFFNPAALKETSTMPQGPALVFAIMMETAIAMVLLSRFLKYGANRLANIIAGIFHTALVAWSLTGARQPLFYIFFASTEIVCTLFIAWYAWKWRNPEGQPTYQSARAN
jgi:hypothetical protein